MKIKISRKVLKVAMAGGVLTAGVVVPTLAVVACGTSSTTSTPVVEPANIPSYTWAGPDVSAKRIFAVMPDPENPRYQRAVQYLNAASVEAKLADYTVQIQKTQQQQNEILGNALDRDGYILGGAENGGFKDALNTIAASAKKAPVVAYDRLLDADTATYNWYVTFQTRVVGRMQGLSIVNKLYGLNLAPNSTDAQVTAAVTAAKKLDAPNRIVAVAGSPADNNAKEYLGGAEDVIEAARKADQNLIKQNGLNAQGNWLTIGADGKWSSTIAQVDWNYETGRAYLQTVLTALPATQLAEVTAILAPNDGMAVSAITAARYAGLDVNKVWITGQDANDSAILSITNGTGQDMTVAKPDYALARVAMAVLAELMTNTTATPQQVLDSITKTYPELNTFNPTLDVANYKTPTGKVINSILLYPVVITSENVKENFKIS